MAETYKQENGQFHLWIHHTKLDAEGKPVLDEKGNHQLEEEQRLAQTVNADGKIVPHSSAAVGVAYTQLPDRLHIFTHGTVEGMQKWVAAHNAHSEHKASLKVFSQATPLDVLNKAIVDGKFLATLIAHDPF